MGRHPKADTAPWADTPRQTPPWADTPVGRHPCGQTPMGRHSPTSDGHCSGQYTSYWKAFLFLHVSVILSTRGVSRPIPGGRLGVWWGVSRPIPRGRLGICPRGCPDPGPGGSDRVVSRPTPGGGGPGPHSEGWGVSRPRPWPRRVYPSMHWGRQSPPPVDGYYWNAFLFFKYFVI